jgi:hypothetical protein
MWRVCGGPGHWEFEQRLRETAAQEDTALLAHRAAKRELHPRAHRQVSSPVRPQEQSGSACVAGGGGCCPAATTASVRLRAGSRWTGRQHRGMACEL